jgi:hypothetical protein
MAAERPKQSGSTGLIYGFNAIAGFKRASIGAGLGVLLTALWLYRHPDSHPLGATLGLLLALGGGAGLAVERLLNYFAGWFVDPIRRYLAALWIGLIELFLLRRFAKRGILTGADVSKLRNRAAKRIVAGESRPYEHPLAESARRSRKPAPPPAPRSPPPPPAPPFL